MSPVQTATKPRLNVGRHFAERARVEARLVRRLGELGAWDVIDAIWDEDTPQLLCGSSPRLKGGE